MTTELATPRDASAQAEMLRQLLPRGRAWNLKPGGVFERLLRAIGEEFARIDARGLDLIEEADPRTALETLADWEAELGLPDECTSAPDGVAERRAAVMQKLTVLGGQNAAWFIDLAARLGYVIEIEEHHPARMGCRCDERLYGQDWAFAWTVHVMPLDGFLEGDLSVAVARIGSRLGVRLRGWGSLDLECVIARARPSQTLVLFTYETEPTPAFWIDLTA